MENKHFKSNKTQYQNKPVLFGDEVKTFLKSFHRQNK